jgi:hypothetical protein
MLSGFGDIVPVNGYEKALCVCAMIMGSWTYAYCLSQATEQIAHMSMADVKFKNHQDKLLEFMLARNLPRELRGRFLAYYEFQRRHAAVFHQCVPHSVTPRPLVEWPQKYGENVHAFLQAHVFVLKCFSSYHKHHVASIAVF